MRRRVRRHIIRWLESTDNLIHAAVLFLIPLLLAFITWIANVTPFISFLVYPPLASGTYTLFADPESKYSAPKKFVGGMTLGALCGWISLEVTARYWYSVPPEQFHVQAGATALAIFLTGLVTWFLDLEEPMAFSTALLALVTGSEEIVYVLGIAISSSIVAIAFTFWYDRFYEHRADYLYQTVQSDDRVLVPIRWESDDETALFAAYIAAAHDAGKVVLYQAIEPSDLSEGDSENLSEPPSEQVSYSFDSGTEKEGPADPVPKNVVQSLRSIETTIEDTVDIPCEMVVARGDPDDPQTVLSTAAATDCDLIVSQFRPSEKESADEREFITGLFRGTLDVIAFHSTEHKTSWSRILVLAKHPGEVAHAMIDFARRIAPNPSNVSICRCIDDSSQRGRAESMLSDLANSFHSNFETRVSYGSVEEFLQRNSAFYDLTIMGSSSERSPASRLLDPPTFENLDDVDSDVAIVHRA